MGERPKRTDAEEVAAFVGFLHRLNDRPEYPEDAWLIAEQMLAEHIGDLEAARIASIAWNGY